MYNVKNYPDPPGVYGDGSHDDSNGLQALINSANDALHFPKGMYRITKTLKIPESASGAVTGHHFFGAGVGHLGSDGSLPGGGRSVILWDPPAGLPAGTPMIEYKGTGLVWHGIALWGKKDTNFGGFGHRADVGIKITKPVGGLLNTGKIWFPAIEIDNCATGIEAAGASADSCAFGYFWPRNCDVAVKLNGTGATMFTFRFIHPLSCLTLFQATGGGGRIYLHSCDLVFQPTGGTVLDVTGSDISTGFFHLNGLCLDGGVRDSYLLKNDDESNALTHVRVTNSHFVNVPQMGDPDQLVHVLIDRTKPGGGVIGQTVLELVGCSGLTRDGFVLTNRVVIKGASSTKPSRLITRDCELAELATLIGAGSTNYSENRRKNWVFNAGLQSDT